jgi:hypothetical protein
VLAALDLLSIIAATGPDHHRIIGERPALPPEVRQALRISSDRALTAVLDEMEAENTAPSAAASEPMVVETPPANADQPDADEPIAQDPPPWPAAREAIVVRGPARLDPWNFIQLDRPARLRLMAELASRPPTRHHGAPSTRIDRAFRAILGAAQIVGLARSGEHQALIQAMASSLELERDFIKACLDDATGEPLAVLLKALGLDNVQAQQVFLLATLVGRDTQSFFRLCDVYAGMEASVAETLSEAWREGRLAKPLRHVPHLAENGNRVRTGAAEQARPSAPAQSKRKAQGSGDLG